mmetsp:Transcript_31191/g.56576  ORF Transcript_31191/g.56576 Transcript_31191/m.56576 type:complete len:293 (+) Transcript_31191:61-939(+)
MGLHELDEVLDTFRTCDDHGSGTLAAAEFIQVLCKIGMAEQRARALVSSISTKSDLVDYAHVITWLFEPLPRKSNACLFDFDGTIAQSEDLHRRTFAEVLGVDLSPDFWNRQCVGNTPKHIIEKQRREEDSRPVEEIIEKRSQLFLDAIGRGELTPTAGIERFMEGLSMKGVRIAVVTSGNRVYIEKALEVLGLAGFVDFLLCGTDEVIQERVKPHPFPYLHAAAELGVEVSSCVVVEDSGSGIRSGQNAGMPVVVIASAVNEKYSSGPDSESIAAYIQDFNSFPEDFFGPL